MHGKTRLKHSRAYNEQGEPRYIEDINESNRYKEKLYVKMYDPSSYDLIMVEASPVLCTTKSSHWRIRAVTEDGRSTAGLMLIEETNIHKMAKKMLSSGDIKHIELPDYTYLCGDYKYCVEYNPFSINHADLEIQVGSKDTGVIRPDGIIRNVVDEQIAIEFYVTHRVGRVKQEKLEKLNFPTLEIDLRGYIDILEDISEEDLIEAIQHKAPRWWVYQKRPITYRLYSTPSQFNKGQSVIWFDSLDLIKFGACPCIEYAKQKAKRSATSRGYITSDGCERCNRNMNFMPPSKWEYCICNQDKTSYIKRVIPLL